MISSWRVALELSFASKIAFEMKEHMLSFLWMSQLWLMGKAASQVVCKR